jgi:hypothetical protein
LQAVALHDDAAAAAEAAARPTSDAESKDAGARAAGVALPTAGLQTVTGADGSEFVVLTAEQLRAITEATLAAPASAKSQSQHQQGSGRAPRRAAAGSALRPVPVTPPSRPHGGRSASPGGGALSPRERAGRLRPFSPARGAEMGEPASRRSVRWEADAARRSTDSAAGLNASQDSALSDGATEVGVAIKRSFGLSATPSAPRGRSVYHSDRRPDATELLPATDAHRHGLDRSHSPIRSPPRQPVSRGAVYSVAALGQST